MRPLNNRRGFTLIELMIVVVIIGILAALGIAKFRMAGHKSKAKEADLILKSVLTSQQLHKAEFGGLAATADQLERVGFVQPAHLEYYKWVPNQPVTFPLCLPVIRAGAEWKPREIDADGNIGNGAG